MTYNTKNRKSVSNLLANGYGPRKLYQGGKRGKALHEAKNKFLACVFKTSQRANKANFRTFSQQLTKNYNDVLSEIQKRSGYQLYYEDVKIMLRAMLKQIREVTKKQAKEKNHIIVPEEVEQEYFGGIAEIESEITGKIGGITIPACVDLKIETSADTFIIRDFKSFERDPEDDPQEPCSENHRHFMQVCLYGVIFEQQLHQTCTHVQLEFFPSQVISYEFTKELKQKAIDFAIENAFEGFSGISYDFNEDVEPLEEAESTLSSPDPPDLPPPMKGQVPSKPDDRDEEALGWINTVKGKPLELIRGKDNKFEGYLYPSKAHKVKDGWCVIVEKEEGGRIVCTVDKIECTEDNYPGETSSHHEEVYKVKLNPEGEFTPEGYEELRPQTIIAGRIKFPTEYEYRTYKKIPHNGIAIGTIEQAGQPLSYHFDRNMLYQSTFIGGVQGTGKTSSIKNLSLSLGQSSEAPAQIIIDNEAEYGDLKDIPSNARSQKLMKRLHLKPIGAELFTEIILKRHGPYCLTLKAINPMDLPYFLRQLTATSVESLLILIDDIIDDHPDREFTLPELRQEIFTYMRRDQYELALQTQQALRRALNSHYLKMFDIPEASPIEIESMLTLGNITVINTNGLADDFQRIVALYFLAMLHKKAMKGSKNIRLLLILDEVQRLLPKSRSTAEADYLKRITGLIDEILHRGRKRQYGVMFATQSPLDVKKEIIDLCNTKLFFQIQGKGLEQLSEYLDKEDRERLKRLPVGHAFITSKGRHEPVEIKFPYLE